MALRIDFFIWTSISAVCSVFQWFMVLVLFSSQHKDGVPRTIWQRVVRQVTCWRARQYIQEKHVLTRARARGCVCICVCVYVWHCKYVCTCRVGKTSCAENRKIHAKASRGHVCKGRFVSKLFDVLTFRNQNSCLTQAKLSLDRTNLSFKLRNLWCQLW